MIPSSCTERRNYPSICSSVLLRVLCGEGLWLRDVTKMAAVTHCVTSFPLALNEIRSVTAFTPFFMVWLQPAKSFDSVLKYPDSVGKTAIPSDSVGYQPNVLNNIDRKTESPQCSSTVITTNGFNHQASVAASRFLNPIPYRVPPLQGSASVFFFPTRYRVGSVIPRLRRSCLAVSLIFLFC